MESARSDAATFAETTGDEKKTEQTAEEVSFHQVVKQPETAETASCRQVSELPETQRISAEAVETPGAAASETKPERSEAIRVREMFALLEKLVQAGLGDAPTQIDGTYIKDFYAVSILRTKDGISVDLTTMR